jgi:hypothetical protein
MSTLPGVTLNVLDGNLGIQPGSNERVMVVCGPSTGGTENTLYSFGDSTTAQTTLGYGKGVEALNYILEIGGGPVMYMPMTLDNAGGKSSVSHVGTGAMTCTVSFAPHVAITISCTTGGTLGTAAFTFTLGSGAASAPVTSASAWGTTGYRVPGTYCTVVFTTGTYVTADVYTISTLGAIAHAAGTGPAVPTITASPADDYNVLLTVTTAGALGTSQFTYSLDNGWSLSVTSFSGSTSANVVSPGGGAYAIPNTGIVLTLSGTAVAGDTYQFTTCGPSASNTNITSAFAALESTFLSQAIYSMGFIVNVNASASAWATEAATVQTAGTALFNAGVYTRWFTEVPTVGTITASAGSVVVDSADTDSVLTAQMASVSAIRAVGGAGDCLLTSGVTGLSLRRSASWVAAARAASVEASEDLGDVGKGGVTGVVYIFRDENATPALDAVGYTTLRKFPGVPGFYITGAHTCTVTTSDYFALTNARVVDRGCAIARLNTLPLVNSKVPTTTRNGLSGVITEKKAQQIEGKLDSALATGLVDIDPADAVAVSATVNRTHNILADGQLIIAVAIQPFAYSKFITVNIGMAVQA